VAALAEYSYLFAALTALTMPVARRVEAMRSERNEVAGFSLLSISSAKKRKLN
jgi:hypothetical protein